MSGAALAITGAVGILGAVVGGVLTMVGQRIQYWRESRGAEYREVKELYNQVNHLFTQTLLDTRPPRIFAPYVSRRSRWRLRATYGLMLLSVHGRPTEVLSAATQLVECVSEGFGWPKPAGHKEKQEKTVAAFYNAVSDDLERMRREAERRWFGRLKRRAK